MTAFSSGNTLATSLSRPTTFQFLSASGDGAVIRHFLGSELDDR